MNITKFGEHKGLLKSINSECREAHCHHVRMLQSTFYAVDHATTTENKAKLAVLVFELSKCERLRENKNFMDTFAERCKYLKKEMWDIIKVEVCDYYYDATGEHLDGCTHKITRSGKQY